MIIDRLVIGPFATNCYIVGDEATKEGIIIDPADEAETILDRVRELELDIKMIVLTHGHVDHIGALKKVAEATGATVAVHEAEAKSLSGWRGALKTILMPGLSYPVPPPPDRLLKDGDRLEMGDLQLEVMYTPGHTWGGICITGEGVVFSGDTLFNYGIGRTDLPGGSYQKLMASIRTRLLALPDETIVYPGHGRESTIGSERIGNPFLTA